MFNPENQYRCTIIRGKAQTELDDLLITYSSIIREITPSDENTFNKNFNDKLSLHFFQQYFDDLGKNNQKTIRNHITEISGKLFGLSYVDQDDITQISDSCVKLLEDNDQISFFKNLCFNFQQPNGSQKIQTVEEKIRLGINSKPLHFLLAVLKIGTDLNYTFNKTQIAYYIFNSLEVLQGKVSPEEVYHKIISDSNNNIKRHIDWSSSRDSQHIREQMNILVLANLIKVENDFVYLNMSELSIINLFISNLDKPLIINPINYNLSDLNQKNKFYKEWSVYNGSINIDNVDILQTTSESLKYWDNLKLKKEGKYVQKFTSGLNTKEIGDEGELIVLDFEKERVKSFDIRLLNKVIHVGGTKGLGYDIISVEADELPTDPEFQRYIEVKTTKRATKPDFNNNNWYDSVNLTKREWIVARQHRHSYNIYRVYLTPLGNNLIKIGNPFLKSEEKRLDVEAIIFKMEFNKNVIDIFYK